MMRRRLWCSWGAVAPLSHLSALAPLATTATVAPWLSGCASPQSLPAAEAPVLTLPGQGVLAAAELPPAAPREFRGAWVATVANIDWPSKPGLPVAEQQQEMLHMLDRARAIGLNAIVLQVRPACDAMYPSRLEPWSEFLTGAQGEAPQPMYDPLAMWVREAHRRGLELHAWFNPYRARPAAAKSAAAASHLSRRRPELVRDYGNQQWLDPGEPDAAAHTLAVVADVLRRYEVDGVHIDDYFYPYPVATAGAGGAAGSSGGELPFPDDASFERYLADGGSLAREDWRRDNVNRLVQQLAATVRRVRPSARLGISPFGLPRPDLRPEGIEGFSQYHKLYADVELWVQKGWFDYLVPQLYWALDRKPQAFGVLMDYWAKRVADSEAAPRHHWPGLYTSSVRRGEGATPSSANARNWPAEEIVQQVALTRERGAAVAGGHIHFSMIALQQDRDGVATRLRQGLYQQDALTPASPWLDGHLPPAPQVVVAPGRLELRASGGSVLNWALWKREAGAWRFMRVPASERSLPTLGADAVVVSAVSASGQESQRVALKLVV